jgi:hypothetical protein
MPTTFEANPSRPTAPANPYLITYALIAANVLVFLAMVATGASFTQPSPEQVFH